MTKKYLKLNSAFTGVITMLFVLVSSCGDDDPAPDAVAVFDYDATTDILGQAPLNVQFTNSSENAESFSWDFGDGETSTEEAPLHVYAGGGVYTVVLTAVNKDGVEFTDQADIELASPLVGTWKLDSTAISTIDTLATLGGIEVGASGLGAPCPATGFDAPDWAGWNGTGWANVYSDENPFGYSTFWSDVIFAGSYFGRTDFFENEFTFTVDGGYQVNLNGELRLTDFVAAVEADYLESEDWDNGSGVSLNEWKSNSTDYTYTITESGEFDNQGALKLSGAGAFLGVYFAGVTGADTYKTPQSEYNFTIASISDTQLIVFGFASSLTCASDLIVMKFKKAE